MGSKNDNKGTNKSTAAADQIAAAEDRVRDEYGRVRTSKLQNELAKGPAVKSSSGDIKTSSGALRQGFKNTPLGRMGLTPSMIGRSDLPTTNTQGNITASELKSIGAMRDVLAGRLPGQVRTPGELEQLSRFNRVLGLNPTSGMGIMGSLRQNFGGLQAQRDFARLGNTAKGIMNLMPGRAIMTGLLNKIPGVNLPTELSMSPINYNITDSMSDFYGEEGFNPIGLSLADQEMFSDPFLDKALFGTPNQSQPINQSQPFQFTGGTPPVNIHDNFKIDPSIYDPSKNIGLDSDQVGRDIMVNPGNDVIGFGAGQVDPQLAAAVNLNEMQPFNSIAAEQLTNPNSAMNQMYNEMGVDMNSQQMGDAITNTFPSFGYFKN